MTVKKKLTTPITRHELGRYVLTRQCFAFQVVQDLFWGLLVEAIVAQNLDRGCAVVPYLLIDCQPLWDLRLGRAQHAKTERKAVFETLCSALALICKGFTFVRLT